MKQPHFQRPSLISSKQMCIKLGMLLYNVFHYIARKLGWWQPPLPSPHTPRQQQNGGVWSARAVQSFKIVFESMPMGSLSCRYFEHLSSSIAMRSRLQFFVSRLATVKNFGIPDFWHQLLQHIAFYRKKTTTVCLTKLYIYFRLQYVEVCTKLLQSEILEIRAHDIFFKPISYSSLPKTYFEAFKRTVRPYLLISFGTFDSFLAGLG